MRQGSRVAEVAAALLYVVLHFSSFSDVSCGISCILTSRQCIVHRLMRFEMQLCFEISLNWNLKILQRVVERSFLIQLIHKVVHRRYLIRYCVS